MPDLVNDGTDWSETAGSLTGRPNKIDDGTNTVTASQARTHLDSVANPHAVTAAQVGAVPATGDHFVPMEVEGYS